MFLSAENTHSVLPSMSPSIWIAGRDTFLLFLQTIIPTVSFPSLSFIFCPPPPPTHLLYVSPDRSCVSHIFGFIPHTNEEFSIWKPQMTLSIETIKGNDNLIIRGTVYFWLNLLMFVHMVLADTSTISKKKYIYFFQMQLENLLSSPSPVWAFMVSKY